MNRKELESRLDIFKEQQILASKAVKDTQKQLDELDNEELKDTQKVLEKFLKLKN